MLYLLHYYHGKVRVALAARTSFAGCNKDGCYKTKLGVFHVQVKKGKNEVSHLYRDDNGHWAKMPYAVYYNGGVAIHQDPLTDESHKCVHLQYMADAKYVNTYAPIGATVVIQNGPHDNLASVH
jgi:hypothetical protein